MDEYFEIQCTNSIEKIKISLCDQDYILGLKTNWYYHLTKKNDLQVSTRVNNNTLYLHDIIVRHSRLTKPSPKHIVYHNNMDPLDNRRSNLVWKTKAEIRKLKK
tara:strand:+ start:7582 stop:7893 length:312 start_codon:yes stop_codon:yes gene_type:complete